MGDQFRAYAVKKNKTIKQLFEMYRTCSGTAVKIQKLGSGTPFIFYSAHTDSVLRACCVPTPVM